jgi:cytochrome c-type biogenesis protein CcmH/NrfF
MFALFIEAQSQVSDEYTRHGFVDDGGYDGDMEAVHRAWHWVLWWLPLEALIVVCLTLLWRRHQARSDGGLAEKP